MTLFFVLSLPFILLSSTSSFAASMFPPVLADLGTGFNSITQEEKGRCVERGERLNQFLGNQANYTMEIISSIEQLRSELGVKGDASLGIGIYEQNCKVDYIKRTEFNRFAVFVIVKVEVKDRTEVLSDYKLTQAAYETLKERGAHAFFKKCGDEFVAGKTYGGELIAVIQFLPKSDPDKRELLSAIASSSVSFRMSGSFSVQFSEKLVSTPHSVRVFKSGGCRSLFDFSEFAADIKKFPLAEDSSKRGQSSLLQAITTSYDHVENLPLNLFEVSTQKQFLYELSQWQDSVLLLKGDIQYLLENGALFESHNREVWKTRGEETGRILDQIGNLARACIKDPELSCNFVGNAVKVPTYVFPTLKYFTPISKEKKDLRNFRFEFEQGYSFDRIALP